MDYLSVIITLIFFALSSVVRELYLIRIEMSRINTKSNDTILDASNKLEDKLNDLIVSIQASDH